MDLDPGRRAALLQPSLSGQAGVQAEAVQLYSTRACFFISFFGGGVAGLIMGWLNARRLSRVAQDRWLLAALAVATLLLLGSFGLALQPIVAGTGRHLEWFGLKLSGREARFINQGAGLAVYGLIHLRHRQFHRAMAIADVPPKKPWGTAAVVFGVSVVVNLAVIGLSIVVLR